MERKYTELSVRNHGACLGNTGELREAPRGGGVGERDRRTTARGKCSGSGGELFRRPGGAGATGCLEPARAGCIPQAYLRRRTLRRLRRTAQLRYARTMKHDQLATAVRLRYVGKKRGYSSKGRLLEAMGTPGRTGGPAGYKEQANDGGEGTGPPQTPRKRTWKLSNRKAWIPIMRKRGTNNWDLAPERNLPKDQGVHDGGSWQPGSSTWPGGEQRIPGTPGKHGDNQAREAQDDPCSTIK